MKKLLGRLSLAAALAGLLSIINYPLSSSAQGTAFTYQGRLNDGSAPANGNYDLRFALYDALTNGSPVGVAITNAPVPVSNGLFTVTLDFGPGFFDGNPRWLEIGVRPNGVNAAHMPLIPRQSFTSAPYAVRALGAGSAATVTGSIAASQLTGTIAAANIGAGTITSNSLAPGAAAANLGGSGQSGVASGGFILSATENSALVSAGYVKIGSTLMTESWQQRMVGPSPAARQQHTAVWTGLEMLIWGGYNGSTLSDGARFNPALNCWTTITSTNAPGPRSIHTAVWTGTYMIIWGGAGAGLFNDGGRYNPVTDAWSAVSSNGAPAARYEHSAIWTGTEMIIWGGSNGGFFNDGGRYNPGTDSWAPITANGAVAIRTRHSALWTGAGVLCPGYQVYGNT